MAVIECFSCSIAEAIWLSDLFESRDFASFLHLISQCAVRKLFLQGDSDPICFAHCLTEHILVKYFIF